MNRAMFSGVAGLKAHQTKMDVIGNNIANVNTYGYKAQHAVFSDVFYQTLNGATAGTDTTGGTNPSSVGYGSKLVAVRSDMSSSSLQSTGNSLDVAITGEGFFTVKNGNNYLYTKAGELGFDTNGYLVDVNGNFVMGTTDATGAGTAADSLSKIQLGTTDELSTLKGISVGSDGSISVTTADGTNKTVGYINIANFANPAGLQFAGSGYFEASANSGAANYCIPGTNGTGALQSSTLEMSNVDLASEFADMITTERGFQANSRIISVSDTMLEELINLKR